jgi:putative acetyltransferase
MVPFEIRKLQHVDADVAAHVLRASFDERLPWLAGLHTPDEDRAFVREHLFRTCELWGAFVPELVGMIAFAPGWVEQLYVLPGWQGRGTGRAMLKVAKAANTELRLWTFQRNAEARRFYEAEGFVAIDETDGSANEEREPDVLYRWAAYGCKA